MKFKMPIQSEDMLELGLLFFCVICAIISILTIILCVYTWLRTLTQTGWLIIGVVVGVALIATYLIYYKTNWMDL